MVRAYSRRYRLSSISMAPPPPTTFVFFMARRTILGASHIAGAHYLVTSSLWKHMKPPKGSNGFAKCSKTLQLPRSAVSLTVHDIFFYSDSPRNIKESFRDRAASSMNCWAPPRIRIVAVLVFSSGNFYTQKLRQQMHLKHGEAAMVRHVVYLHQPWKPMHRQVWTHVDHLVPFLLPSCAFCEEIEALSTDLLFFEKATRSQDTPWSDWRLPLNH